MTERADHLRITNSITAARRRLAQLEGLLQHDDQDHAIQLTAASDRLAQTVAEITTAAAHLARSRGATWSAIGNDLGVSKQAAQQRFAAHHEDGTQGV